MLHFQVAAQALHSAYLLGSQLAGVKEKADEYIKRAEDLHKISNFLKSVIFLKLVIFLKKLYNVIYIFYFFYTSFLRPVSHNLISRRKSIHTHTMFFIPKI